MPWDVYVEWVAFYRLDPWGEERGDLRAGIVASTIANVNRGKRSKAFKPGDFMPKFGQERNGGSRKPLTDPAEWNRAKRMASVLA